MVSRVAVMEDLNLSRDEEEADTKIILYCTDARYRNSVYLWSLSGNTDIVALAVGLF